MFPWLQVVGKALEVWSTPFYINAWPPIRQAVEELKPLNELGIPVRHWLSVKTQPVKPIMVQWRREFGFGAEVISKYELQGAQAAGFPPDSILVNGMAKHRWLPDIPGLRVHFDSPAEIRAIDPERLKQYRLGARCHLETGHNPNDPTIGAQFGMTIPELCEVVEHLDRCRMRLDGLHFHLRSSITDPETYAASLRKMIDMGEEAGVSPSYVDLGGGFPSPGESIWDGERWIPDQLPIEGLVCALKPVLASHPSVAEIWFENGRFMTSRCGVLVIKILEVKERAGCRFLICDGGRTNHALPSDWQAHAIESLPERHGKKVESVVCGPTCTAYDRLVKRELPEDLRAGDYLVWFNAGAYHLSWETRFSHGLANVIWCDENLQLSLARPAEEFEDWWGRWR